MASCLDSVRSKVKVTTSLGKKFIVDMKDCIKLEKREKINSIESMYQLEAKALLDKFGDCFSRGKKTTLKR